MEEAKYILRANEAVLMPVNENKWISLLKKCIYCIIAVLIIGSFIFHDNLFFELTWTSRIILISLTVWISSLGSKSKDVPSPMELQFFDDYLIFYLPKRYYSKKTTIKSITKMYYKDIIC